MTQRDLRIRPLSEGIGLGSLKSSTPKIHVTDIDTSVMRQAHAAYAPFSVEAEIRKRAVTNWSVKSIRFLASSGVDIFVGVISAFIIAWISALAWSAGETGSFDVLGALNSVTGFLTAQSIPMLVMGTLVTGFIFRFFRYLIERFS